MQGVAAWLVARPQHGILALAVTSSPVLGFLSSSILVLLVLKQGPRLAVIQAALAGACLTIIGLVAGTAATVVASGALAFWLPALLLGLALRATRSLTLVLQIIVTAIVAAMIGFFLIVGDPVAFWEPELLAAADVWQQMGFVELADSIQAGHTLLAAQMTMFAAVSIWTLYATAFVFGYVLYRRLPGETADCGRFTELNFGRVIASTMALASVVALLTGATWLQNIAFVLFAVFWLQGLAIVHWMHERKLLSVVAVAAIYVLMLLVSAVMVIALAVFGYIDAWFRIRQRAQAG